MKFNSLKEKCLYYRGLTDYKIIPNSNIIVMLDGKNFSKLVKKSFKMPFDDDFIDIMNKTALFLCNNVQGVKLAYVQSDEISLLITDYDTPETDTAFGGRLCKIQSILASMATSEFNRWFMIYNLNKEVNKPIGHDKKKIITTQEEIENMKLAQFDCKVWTVPNQNDAFAWFLYRQIDCVRNSKQQTAQTYLSHKELLGKNTDEQIELCKERFGIDWNNYNEEYKFGRLIYKEENIFFTKENNEYKRSKFYIFPSFDMTLNNSKERFYNISFPKKENDI